jgi:nicotinamide-nucleotide amidase
VDLSVFEPEVLQLAAALRHRGWRLATAESCTGGLIAAACTAVAGSSDWFERGFVSYSNAAKSELLGVDAALIAEHGAVSEPVVRAMALGALERSRVEIAVAVTGVAGPGGGTRAKPVGTVWLAVAGRFGAADALAAPQLRAMHLQLGGDRTAVRRQTVAQALSALLAVLE